MKKNKPTFLKWSTPYSNEIKIVVMRSPQPEEYEIQVNDISGVSGTDITMRSGWMLRNAYVPATAEEFAELYTKVSSKINRQILINL